MPRVLDNSQYSAWLKCPMFWFTAYVAGVQKEHSGPRNDALCLGSLYHNGMENWYGKQKVQINQECVDENTPDKETLDLALDLITHYTRKYPSDPWEVESIEQVYQKEISYSPSWNAIAKVDQVVVISKPTEIVSGLNNNLIVVPPGRYALEHKTKSGFTARESYITSWRRRKQVDFQMLCSGVDGVIVNVAEKPAKYQPKRKCQGCKETKEFKTWVPIEGQRYQCPDCQHEQELKALTQDQIKGPDPDFFRIPCFRTRNQLEQSWVEIKEVAKAMDGIISGNKEIVPNILSCVDERWNRNCDYLLACEALTDPLEQPGFVKVIDPLAYIGLED